MSITIKLPSKKEDTITTPEVNFDQMVVIGANGSGKTRFGAKIEETYPKKVHRVSAQKSLKIPIRISPTTIALANEKFYSSGSSAPNVSFYSSQKQQQRWSGSYASSVLNDYEALLTLLHTEEYELSLDYKEGRIDKPVTRLDRAQNIWEQLLPLRKLYKKAGVIEAYPSTQETNKYHASEMSDGERVIL